MHIHVDEVLPTHPASPLLLNFQNGYVTDEFRGSNKLATILSGAGKTVVAAEVGGVLYAGEKEEEELRKTLLLVRSKKTGKVRVMEVGTASMKAVVHSAPTLSSQLVEVNSLEVSRKFGSKRDKQRMEQREKLKVNTETVTNQLKSVADDATAVDKIDLKTYTKTDSEDFYIPPINRNTENVKDVYEVNKILNQDQVDKITDEIASKDYEAELHPYIKGFFIKNSSKTEKALLLFANSLLKLYLTVMKEMMKKSFAVCEVSPAVNEICFDNFTVISNGRRMRSNQYKDKALCHLIVIILLLNNFKFDLDAFSTAVKITPNTVIVKTRAVGAHVSSDKKKVVLKLPLNTAKSFVSRRKSAKF